MDANLYTVEHNVKILRPIGYALPNSDHEEVYIRSCNLAEKNKCEPPFLSWEKEPKDLFCKAGGTNLLNYRNVCHSGAFPHQKPDI